MTRYSRSGTSHLYRLFALCMAVGTLMVLVAVKTGRAYDIIYDENGYNEEPIFCPITVPNAQTSQTTLPETFELQKWSNDDGRFVPFFVSQLTLTTRIQAVNIGEGWYTGVPRPTNDNFDGERWMWDGPGGVGGAFARCSIQRYLFGLLVLRVVDWHHPLNLWGYAFPSYVSDTTRTARQSGGSAECDGILWEFFDYWYDVNGNYHEEITGDYCEPQYET